MFLIDSLELAQTRTPNGWCCSW